MNITIQKVTAEEIRPLRHDVLRKGKPFSTTKYNKDNHKETFHLACFVKKKIIGCATFYPEKTSKMETKNGYRLRGMATNEKHRKKGYGKKIIQKATEKIQQKAGDILWCNARLVAVGFYKKMGFKITGELFDISDIGPHYLMYKKL